MTLPDSPSARSHGSCGPAPQAYSGQLTHGTPPPSRLDSSHIPPGHPASLSYCPPLAVQLPHHSDRAPCTQRKRSPESPRHLGRHYTSPARHIPASLSRARRGHVTLGSTAHAPQTKTNCGRARAAPSRHATLGHVSGTTARRYPGFRRQQEPRSTCRRADHPHHVTRQAPRGLRQPKPLKRGHPTRRASTGGGGSTPNPPCCSPFGDANGVRNP